MSHQTFDFGLEPGESFEPDELDDEISTDQPHVMTALGPIAQLGPVYLVGVAGVAVLLAYEQSLVRADDLSQVKRAFDLNGYVGLLYLAATAAAMYVH